MEKARLDGIKRLLEITERKCNHDILLSTKNLHELGASPFPYIVPIIPRLLLEDLIKDEHFILADLLKSIPCCSSQAGFDQEPQAEFAQEALTTFVRPDQSPLVVQDPKPAPQAAKKKKGKKREEVGQVKPAYTGLEGFVDWVIPTLLTGETEDDRHAPQIASEPAEESEHDMSSLAIKFFTRMFKQAASAQGETTPGSEVPGSKHPKRSGLNEEVQNSPTVITSDSLEQASDALPTLKGAAQDASKEACASLEDGTSTGGPPSINKVGARLPLQRQSLVCRSRLDGITSQLPALAGQGVLIGWC